MFHSACNSYEGYSTIVLKVPLLGKCYIESKAKNLFVKDLVVFLFGLDHPLKTEFPWKVAALSGSCTFCF